MRFLNPRTDFAFKRIFGSDASHEVLISFLNAVLGFKDEDLIIEVAILDPYQAPRIVGLKDSFLDVRARDQRGRQFIIEMQVLNVPGFEKRVLYNACKTYSNQLVKGEAYGLLLEVIAITVTDFKMFPKLPEVINTFRLRAAADVEVNEQDRVTMEDLALVFIELPKFKKTEDECVSTLDRWLLFLREAGCLDAVPAALAAEPAIARALELANLGALTREELDAEDRREDWIRVNKAFYKSIELMAAGNREEALKEGRDEGLKEGRNEGLKEGRDEGLKEGRDEGLKEGRELGKIKGKAESLLRLLHRRFGPLPANVEPMLNGAKGEQLDAWFDAALDAPSLEAVFRDVSVSTAPTV